MVKLRIMKKDRNTVAFSLFASAVFCAHIVCAEDLTIAAGETVAISGAKTYGTITCDGNLTIADDSVITCETFILGTELGKRGVAEIGNRVSMSITGDDYKDFVIGTDGGAAKFTIGTNSVVQYKKYFCIRHFSSDFVAKLDVDPSLIDDSNQVLIHLKDNASISCSLQDSVVYFSGIEKLKTSSARYVGNVVQLDDGAVINASCFALRGCPHSKVLFNGGGLKQGAWNNFRTSAFLANAHWQDVVASKAKCYFTGTNGNDIVLFKDSWSMCLFASPYGGGSFVCDGDGDVIIKGGRQNAWINGTLWCDFVYHDNFIENLINFNNKKVRFEGIVRLKTTTKNMSIATNKSRFKSLMSKFAELHIGPKVAFDLYGFNLKAGVLNAEGQIFSSKDPEQPEVVFGGADGDCYLGDPGTNTVFRKIGTGALVLSNVTDVAVLSVTTGAVTFAANPAQPVKFGSLMLGENVSFMIGEGRALNIGNLSLDMTSSVSSDVFHPLPEGRLELFNADIVKYPVLLPFTADSVLEKKNLADWTLYIDGELKGAVGSPDPAIGFYSRHLMLGRFGTRIIVR